MNVYITTKDRPLCLERCIASYAANAAAHGRMDVQWCVTDASSDPWIRRANEAILMRLRTSLGLDIKMSDPSSLMLFGTSTDVPGFGASRNIALLDARMTGQRCIMIDDDTACLPAVSPLGYHVLTDDETLDCIDVDVLGALSESNADVCMAGFYGDCASSGPYIMRYNMDWWRRDVYNPGMYFMALCCSTSRTDVPFPPYGRNEDAYWFQNTKAEHCVFPWAIAHYPPKRTSSQTSVTDVWLYQFIGKKDIMLTALDGLRAKADVFATRRMNMFVAQIDVAIRYPESIILRDTGRPLSVDFGVVKAYQQTYARLLDSWTSLSPGERFFQ